MDLPDLPDLPDAADAAGDAARWAWKNWDVAAKRLAALRNWFRGVRDRGGEMESGGTAPVRPILILGPGGVGKTTFGMMIAGDEFGPIESSEDYRESLNVETYEFAGQPDAAVIVPPGQGHRRSDDWDDLLSRLAGGEFRGVMLFAAYGHHTLVQFGGYRAHPLHDGGKTKFLKDYLSARRDEEVAVAGRVAASLKRTPEPVWLLSCVTKQDLWWPTRPVAETFYRTGPFAAALNAGLEGCDSRLVRRELAFCCLRILNFRDRQREVLVPNAAGFDDAARDASVRRLIERLDDLRVWEQQR